jgi:hypothetical protein
MLRGNQFDADTALQGLRARPQYSNVKCIQ